MAYGDEEKSYKQEERPKQTLFKVDFDIVGWLLSAGNYVSWFVP